MMSFKNEKWGKEMFEELKNIIVAVKESEGWSFYEFAKKFPTVWEFLIFLSEIQYYNLKQRNRMKTKSRKQMKC